MRNNKTRDLAITALMAALVFVTTYIIRVPNPLTGGYAHLGDCMIFFAVAVIGKRNGAIAAGIGGAMSDLLAGAAVWIVPTFIVKFVMAYIMGTVIGLKEDRFNVKVAGAACGGVFQIVGYTALNMIFYGKEAGIVSLPAEIIQTSIGVVLFAIIFKIIGKNAGELIKGKK